MSGETPTDPLWQTVHNLTTEVSKLTPRIITVEEVAKEAHDIAVATRAKIDLLALTQVQAQKDFTHAIQAQTTALQTFGAGLDDVKSIGRWLLVLIVIMSMGTFVTLLLTLLRG